jgi:hypothetical protein
MYGPEVMHSLPVEPEAALFSGHRIVLFIDSSCCDRAFSVPSAYPG